MGFLPAILDKLNPSCMREDLHGEETYIEKRLIWRRDLHGEETSMERRLTWRGDLHREETGLTWRLAWRGDLQREGTYTKTYTEMGNTRRGNLNEKNLTWRVIYMERIHIQKDDLYGKGKHTKTYMVRRHR